MHTALTHAMEAWMASKIDAEMRNKEKIKRFAKWQSHWTNRFAALAEGEHFLCPCGQSEYDVFGMCPKCGMLARPSDCTVDLWRPFAQVLGHVWATNLPDTLCGQFNLSELVYTVDGLKLWGNWGYNPPLTYESIQSTEAPWTTSEVVHTTSKQKWHIRKEHIIYSLTTTTGLPVATARAVDRSFVIWNLNPENTIGRLDRWDWLETWVSTLQDLGWEVSIEQYMAASLTKCEWDDRRHPRLAALQGL